MTAAANGIWRALATLTPGAPGRFLTVIGDQSGWVLDHEARQVGALLRRQGVSVREARTPWPNQPAFFAAREQALHQLERWQAMRVPVCFPYYHGYPGDGDRAFDATYAQLVRGHRHVARIQVTHARMHEAVLASGIDASKVHRIAIGVDTTAFTLPGPGVRETVRARLGVPASAVVVGSFQKDGNGWGEGLEPKRVKAPEILVAAIVELHARIPELWVLLSGPARGYVMRALSEAGVPFVYAGAGEIDVPSLYHAIDVYLVSSRQEGGPKAVLESMASGIPIVSTRVGQATAVIEDGLTGFLVDIDDAEALAEAGRRALDATWQRTAIPAARAVAERHDYANQTPQWLAFFDGLVARDGAYR